jgi:ribokinase
VRIAVVGHVEWVDFVEVPRLPKGGEILAATGAFTRAAGGGGVAAVVLAGLGAEVHFFCALGEDADGHAAADQLTERGVRVHAAWRPQPTRRAITLLEEARERTIVTIGERLAPLGADPLAWDELNQAQGVYFTAGDAAAMEHARRARIVTATPRARDVLEGLSSPIDALIWSNNDPVEVEWARRLTSVARVMVATRGQDGGVWSGAEHGSWAAAPPPGPPRDSYGCGDSFAAGFTFGLAEGRSVAEAAALGAELGARCLTLVGPP